jgi:hypothetical protein
LFPILNTKNPIHPTNIHLCSPSWTRWIQYSQHYSFKMYFNIILLPEV